VNQWSMGNWLRSTVNFKLATLEYSTALRATYAFSDGAAFAVASAARSAVINGPLAG
jgi:hypothetical protein